MLKGLDEIAKSKMMTRIDMAQAILEFACNQRTNWFATCWYNFIQVCITCLYLNIFYIDTKCVVKGVVFKTGLYRHVFKAGQWQTQGFPTMWFHCHHSSSVISPAYRPHLSRGKLLAFGRRVIKSTRSMLCVYVYIIYMYMYQYIMYVYEFISLYVCKYCMYMYY